MHVQKYIEKLDMAIDELIEMESQGITKAEYDLHVLLENRKNVKHWKDGHKDNPHSGMLGDNPRKSYF